MTVSPCVAQVAALTDLESGKDIYMRRFFYQPDQQAGPEQIVLTGPEAHHIKTVLRMSLGAQAELFDGQGRVVQGQISQIRSDQVCFQILSSQHEGEQGPPLTLALGLLKGKKMDLVIQKATELGVHRLIPTLCHYCEKEKIGQQVEQRWQRIILEACKQCRRPIPMQVHPSLPLSALPLPEQGYKIMPWEGEERTPFPRDLPPAPVLLLIGPEGGFHPSEVLYARDAGFTTVSLGPRILRAETAALSAVVLAQHLLINS